MQLHEQYRPASWAEVVGRHVKKGEKALHILCPCVGKKTETDP
jgi:hypothetical protein